MSVCIPRVTLQGALRSLTLETLGPVGTTILTVPGTGGLVGGLPAGTPGQILSVDGGGNLIWVSSTTPGSHVLAGTAGLGASHTVSGLTAGMYLRATGATTAAFQLIPAGDLPAHSLLTAHTVTGLTPGYVLTALTSNTFGFAPGSPFTKPMVVSAGGVLTEYATIAAAIAAATSGQTVSIPPGTYTENITLKNGVLVTELISGTVTLNGVVTTAIGGFLQIDQVTAFGTGVAAISAGHSSGVSCVIIVRNIIASGVLGTSYGINKSGVGDLIVYARTITSTNPAAAYGINVTAGTLSVFGAYVIASDLDLRQTAGTLSVGGGVNYSTSSGVITILPGSGGASPSGGAWTSYNAGSISFAPDLPAIVNAGVVTEYATIQDAIDAAGAGDRVLIPPGQWNEQITLKNGIRVVEAFPGTVVLTWTGGGDGVCVNTADGGFLEVEAISCTTGADPFVAIQSIHTTTCTIKVHRIQIEGPVHATGVFGSNAGGGGTLYLWADEIYGSSANSNMIGVSWDRGALFLYMRGKLDAQGSSAGTGIQAYGGFGLATVDVYGATISGTDGAIDGTGAGIITLHDCIITRTSILASAGTVLYGEGDRASAAEAVKLPLMHQ